MNFKLIISIISFLVFIVFMNSLKFRNDTREEYDEIDTLPVVKYTKNETNELLILTWTLKTCTTSIWWMNTNEGYHLKSYIFYFLIITLILIKCPTNYKSHIFLIVVSGNNCFTFIIFFLIT